MALPTSLLSAGSLVGSYAVGRATGVRPLAGVGLLAGAAACARSWSATGAPVAQLLATYVGAFGASHPLSKRVGAWPSVLGVAAVTGLASHLLADRRV